MYLFFFKYTKLNMKKAHPELKNQFSKLQQSMNIRMSRLAKEKGPKENEVKYFYFVTFLFLTTYFNNLASIILFYFLV